MSRRQIKIKGKYNNNNNNIGREKKNKEEKVIKFKK